MGVLFPSIASNGTFSDVIVQAQFAQAGEMNDERVDLIIDMYRNNYDWSKHVWAYHEPRHSYVPSSDEENTEAEGDVETSENEMEEEPESAAAPVERKRKKLFQDTGVQSRKKSLLSQRSAEKYRELEEEMKSYIHGMFKSSFTSLALDVHDTINDRFTIFEEKLLASQNRGLSHGPTPTAPDSNVSDIFGSLFETLDANLGTQEYLQKTMGNLTQESHVIGFDPSQDMKSKVKDEFTTPMTSFPREDFKRPFLVDDDTPEVRCKDSDYALVFVPDDKWEKLNEWSLNPTRLKLGPSIFDGTLCKRIIGPGQWFKNFVKSEMVRVEHEMSEKLNDKVNLEIARVAQEMKQKLKIATMPMVVAGAIVGIWTSLTV
ncbi:unnamed protein product [Eruca vesicaria subsp. sativa]|uniref:Uncharacterized protein n=1 Tax=Eruca vesicaria subsp. sativa TaxID=29727 RepID=A0ABC8K980_ERUVS|nr:unnamed protein product [Eruca vesicaria subsp. sativa]